jgi:hypothetical protein
MALAIALPGLSAASRMFRSGCCALAAGLAFVTHTAVAAELVSFGYPPQAVFPFGAATVSSEIQISNSDVGIHGFFLNLVLPQDYKTNGKVWIVVYLTTGVAKPCNMRFEPAHLTRWRPGLAPGMFSAGLAPKDGSNHVAFPNSDKVMKKIFIVSPDPAFRGGQRPGDALRIGLGRDGGHPSDTCNGNVQVPAIDIRYPRAP